MTHKMGRRRHAARHSEQSARLRSRSRRDGTVTIICHRSEMGQGVRTGIPLIVADELEADWSRVKVAQAPGDEAKFGNQDTDGSRSTRHFMKPMRQCWRRRSHDAGGRPPRSAGAFRLATVEAKNHEVVQKSTGAKARLWRTRRRRQAKLAVPRDGQPAAQGPVAVPLYRQGRDQDRRRLRHHDRPRRLRQDVRLPGHDIRCHRPPASGGRQGRVLRRRRGA